MVSSQTILDRPTTQRTQEIRQLTGLRGLAAFDVMLGHYDVNYSTWAQSIIFHNAAVDIFFCLSAFTLLLVYRAGGRTRIDWRDFAVARFARVYPMFFAATTLTLAYSLAWDVGGFDERKPQLLIRQGLRQFLLVGAWPLPGHGGFWVAPAWSVSVEFFCYLVMFPLLFAGLPHARRVPAGLAACLMVVCGVTSVVLFSNYFSPNVNLAGFAPPPHAIAYYLPLLRGVLMFVAGWLAYAIWERRDVLATGAAVMTDALALAFVSIVVCGAFGMIDKQFVIVLAPFLILGLMDGRSVTSRFLASKPLHALGLISYSLYLIHLPVWVICLRFAPDMMAWQQPAMLFPGAVTLVVATACYWLIERPSRRLIRSTFGMRAA